MYEQQGKIAKNAFEKHSCVLYRMNTFILNINAGALHEALDQSSHKITRNWFWGLQILQRDYFMRNPNHETDHKSRAGVEKAFEKPTLRDTDVFNFEAGNKPNET